MKKCLYCSEEIQDDAIKCRYCGESQTGQPAQWQSFLRKYQAMTQPERDEAAKTLSYEQRVYLQRILSGEATITNDRSGQPRTRFWNPGIAALLSFIIPGAGQMYRGYIGTGIAWFFLVIIGYVAFIIPGIVFHLICIFMAASGDPYRERG